MSLLDKFVGTEGMKMDVSVSVSPDIYAKLFVTIVGAVLVSVMGAQLIANAIK